MAQLIEGLQIADPVCYQMDLHDADRLCDELQRGGQSGQMVTAPDLWDISAAAQTAIFPVAQGGERDLKIDMVEQAFHVLRPHGKLIVLSPYETDQLFPTLLKKIFGRAHAPAAGNGMVHVSQRQGDRPRRRHEVLFHARAGDAPSLRFLSRPGTFSYGRFDDGARALVETMTVEPGDRVLDMGCGCGTNGIFAGLRAGPTGHVTFVDSNVRAVALAEHNARLNWLTAFETIASCKAEGLSPGTFDVALANPPYYAQATIAQLFIDRCRELLHTGGRFYLVTKQVEQVGPLVEEKFALTDIVQRRGYAVFCGLAQ